MQLYLLRHADAEPHASSDAARALTDKGCQQAKRVGKFCRDNDLVPSVILTSPLVRAEQTARKVAAQLEGTEVIVAPFLKSGMHTATALEELKAYLRFNSVMLVGHEPDFGELAAKLLGAAGGGRIQVRKASLLLFEMENANAASAVLQFSIPVKLM
jgi:phosphohistidine phosphatase